MQTADWLERSFATPMSDFISLGIGLSIFYIVTNLLLVAAVFFMKRHPDITWPEHGFWRFIFPKEVWLHPSAIFDYQFYIFIRMLKPLTYGSVFLIGGWVSSGFASMLAALFGPPEQVHDSYWLYTAIETIALFLAFDFGYWFAHMLMHKVRWMWEFHKGHHAAEVMTPFTVLRMHPFEEFESGFFIVCATGVTHVLLTYAFGAGASEYKLLGTNVIVLVFYFTIFNLRHSHIWLPLTGFWGVLLHSPAHHQLHHSNNPRHYGKNMGFCLSIWDWMFGTLWVPGKEPITKLGIGAESAEFNKFWPFLYLPFVNAYRLWTGKTPLPPTKAVQ